MAPVAAADGSVVANSNGDANDAAAVNSSDDNDEVKPICLDDISEEFKIPQDNNQQQQLKQ